MPASHANFMHVVTCMWQQARASQASVLSMVRTCQHVAVFSLYQLYLYSRQGSISIQHHCR